MRTHKPTIRLDDTKYNATMARVLTLLWSANGELMTRWMIARRGAASECYLRSRMWEFEGYDLVEAKAYEIIGRRRGRGWIKGYRLTAKGKKRAKDLWTHHRARVFQICKELGIKVEET